MVPIGFTKPKRYVDQVFLHCSASDVPAHDNLETIRRWHLDRGWRDVGYHYFIRKDGTLERGRDIESIPAAQAGHNEGAIAICLSGGQNGRNQFTDAQRVTLRRLARAICAAYDGQIRFRGHKEVANKDCPVFAYREWLDLDAEGYMAQPPKSLRQSRTLRGGRWAMAGTLLTPLLNALGEAETMLAGLPAIARALAWLALLFAILGLGLMVWARLDDQLNLERKKI
jgi:hypothetical protein